ncbi:MAG: hypothetical protein LUB59_01250 [Candidatus Gastranaerophilales bacterium]|nr:hypothetical protein [Candidatus Gastranaerophilales bacterium]
MSFGISGNDPFKSYSSNADAGGGMGVYARKRKKEDKKQDNENLLDIAEDTDDDNLEIEFDDADFMD